MKLWEFLKTNMLKNPNQTICEDGAKMKFDDLVVFAEVFAKKLNGIKTCAIFCESEFSAAISLLACFAAGVTAVPLSRRYGEIHCKKIIEHISPQAIITDENGQLNITTYCEQVDELEIKPALIMCTSGTTGTPKGAMLSEKNIITNTLDIADYFDISIKDTVLISRPIYHCAVLTGELLVGLIKGANIRFYSGTFNPALLLDMINKYDITTFCGTPTLISMLGRINKNSEKTSLKNICISGECLDKETGEIILKKFPKSKIYHVYGLTEASPRVCYLPPELFGEYPDCVGMPLKSVSLKIIDSSGNEIRDDREGILWIKGENVMQGYYKDSALTNQILKDGWLCTGDVAVKNDRGLIKIKGRKDDLIIKAGMNIYPSEIESVIKKDSRVSDVLVYGYDTHYGKQIGMKVIGQFSSIADIKKLCVEKLPSFQVPTTIELVLEFDKNATGKKLRRQV